MLLVKLIMNFKTMSQKEKMTIILLIVCSLILLVVLSFAVLNCAIDHTYGCVTLEHLDVFILYGKIVSVFIVVIIIFLVYLLCKY